MGVGGGGSSFIEEIGFFGHTVSSLWFVGSLLWPVGAFFRCAMQASRCGPLEHTGSVAAAHGLSFPTACGILVPQPEIKFMSPALEGGFSTTGPLGKSRFHLSYLLPDSQYPA